MGQVKDVLTKLTNTIEAITPSVGRVHSKLARTVDQKRVEQDFLFDDPVVKKKLIKVFFVRPGEGDEAQQSLAGGPGFAISEQLYTVRVVMSVVAEAETEQIIEDDFERIRKALRPLKASALLGVDKAFLQPTMRWSSLATVSFANQICYTKILTVSVQFPKLS